VGLSATGTLPARAPARPLRALAGEQIAVAAGQLAAGVGNLAFSLAAARLLAPGAFADLAAFLALYLVIHVPTASLSAGSALRPEMADQARRRVLLGGLGAGAALAAAAVPLAAVLHVPVAMLFALAAATPASGLLALERGRLYGLGRTRRAAASLLAEPVVRLAAGVALGAAAGAAGAAAGVVLAGWAALAVAHVRDGARAARSADRDAAPGATATTATTVFAFLGLALVQNQDVLAANAFLDGAEAGRFAVLSTLGGIAAFATTTVPLMLLPRAAAGERGALTAALGVAVALGAAAVAIVAVDPTAIVEGVFGARYADVAPLAGPYLVAMALLGVARVLIAHACATGAARAAMAALGAALVLHVVLLVVLGDSAEGIARATLFATVALTAAAAGATVVRLPGVGAQARAALGPRPGLVGLALAACVAAGLVLRLLATRGLWLDEATSVQQAQLPFGDMLTQLRTTDVHPPLHHAVLWGIVRALGTSEFAVRLPSLIAMTGLIPVLYLAGRDLYDRRTGLAAAALATVAPFTVWYADEARMYALFMLFGTLALWFLVRAIRGGRTRDFLLWALAAAVMAWTQYFAVLFVGAQMLGFLAAFLRRGAEPTERRGRLLRLLGATALLALAVAPLAPFALDQFSANEAAGRGFAGNLPSQAGATASQNEGLAQPSVYAAITNVLWAVVGYHSDATMTRLAALWPLAILGALALLGRGRSRVTQLLVLCALVPMAGLFAVGQLKPFVFEVRYFSVAVPIAILLIARAATGWTRRAAPAAATVSAVGALLGAGVADQQLNSSNPRQFDFRGAVEQIDRRAGTGDVVLLSPPYVDSVVAYYSDGLTLRAADGPVPVPRRGRKVFVLGSFFDKPQYAALTRRSVTRLRRDARQVSEFRRSQIRVWEFTR
jgi:O-antigen/teichoic acid export membrane protein